MASTPQFVSIVGAKDVAQNRSGRSAKQSDTFLRISIITTVIPSVVDFLQANRVNISHVVSAKTINSNGRQTISSVRRHNKTNRKKKKKTEEKKVKKKTQSFPIVCGPPSKYKTNDDDDDSTARDAFLN